jgi:hypothetical protein
MVVSFVLQNIGKLVVCSFFVADLLRIYNRFNNMIKPMGNMFSMCEAHEILYEVRQRLRRLELAIRDMRIWQNADSANSERIESEMKKMKDEQIAFSQRLNKMESGYNQILSIGDNLPPASIVTLRKTNSKLW